MRARCRQSVSRLLRLSDANRHSWTISFGNICCLVIAMMREAPMARRQDYSRTVSWAFVHHAESSQWTWRQLSVDGSIAHISSPLFDFGAAVVDAIRHGFRPKEHHWIVTNTNGTTHFHPGNPPLSIPPDGLAVKPPKERRRLPKSGKETQRAD